MKAAASLSFRPVVASEKMLSTKSAISSVRCHMATARTPCVKRGGRLTLVSAGTIHCTCIAHAM